MVSYFNKNRVETFSDGIFAIIVTLLVLEIKVPHLTTALSVGELSAALISLLPKFISWVISFLIVCVVWVNHHRLFENLRDIDQKIFWLNANLLLWISFIPFPTALMGDYPRNSLAVSFFGIVLALMGAAFVAVRFYIYRQPQILTHESSAQSRKKAVVRTVLYGFGLYLLGAATPIAAPEPENKLQLDQFIQYAISDQAAFSRAFVQNTFHKELSAENLAFYSQMGTDATLRAMVRGLEELRTRDLVKEVMSITLPTLICHGAHDKVVPFAAGEAQHQLIKNSKLVRFEESGHGLFYDEAEKINRELHSFVG